MKKSLFTLLSTILAVTIVLGLTSCVDTSSSDTSSSDTPCEHVDLNNDAACDECEAEMNTPDNSESKADEHVHSFTEKKHDEKYLAFEANCQSATSYYYSCVCGEAGEAVFTVDDVLGLHNTENGKCTVCGLPESSEGLSYRLNSNGTSYTVTGIGTCTDTHIVIGSYNNKSVTAIGTAAFYYKKGFTEITISDTVTSIGGNAFAATDITNVTIPGNISIINEMTFSFCLSLETVVISEGVTKIQQSAFAHCDKLTNVTLPQSLTKIDVGAFMDCDKLSEITIPKNVVEIGVCALHKCPLTSVTFEITEGWMRHSSDTSLNLIGSGTPVDVEYLQDSATAAEYVQNSSNYYGWKRS